MPKKQVNVSGGAIPASSKRDGFELVPLMAPVATWKQYLVPGGYRTYVADYRFYLESLKEIKQESIIEKKQTAGTKLVVVDVSSKGANVDRWVLYIAGNVASQNQWASGENVTFKYAGFSVGPAELRKLEAANASLIAGGAPNSKNVSGVWGVTIPGLFVKKLPAVTSQTFASVVRRETKAKGPAITPKKVRSAEEIAERKKKENARKERSAWFGKRKLELAKGKLEEKLASSVAKRAAKIVAADPSVSTSVDLDGWRVVTKDRPVRSKVTSVLTTGGSKVTTVKNVVESARTPV